jgi:hypothetical protein
MNLLLTLILKKIVTVNQDKIIKTQRKKILTRNPRPKKKKSLKTKNQRKTRTTRKTIRSKILTI